MKTSTATRSTVFLFGMSFAKIVFPLVTLPYLTRILSLESYGAVNYVKQVLSYVQVIIEFGFMLSGTKDIALCGNDISARNRVISKISEARIILALMSFFVTVVLSFTVPILRNYRLYTFLMLIPAFLNIFLFEFFFRGIEKMGIVSAEYILTKGISTALTFVFVKGDADILWIPVLDIIGTLVAVLFVFVQLIRYKVRITPVPIGEAIRTIRESFIYFLSKMASTIFAAFNTVVIGFFMTEADIAHWSLCMQIVSAIILLYTPIVDGIYPSMMKSRDFRLVKRVLLIFMPVVAAGCVFSGFLADFGIEIAAGEKYLPTSAILFRYLIPVLFFAFPAQILGWPSLGALKKEKYITATTILTAVFQIVMLLILGWTGKFTLINLAIVRSATELLLLGVRFGGCLYFLKHPDNGTEKE